MDVGETFSRHGAYFEPIRFRSVHGGNPALAGTGFDSQKRVTVSLINEGDVIVLRLSRATESGRSTLDARCPATQRRTIQTRIGALVRGRVDLMRESTAFSAASSIEFVLDDALFDTFDSVGDLDYRPALRAHAAPFHHEHDAAHRGIVKLAAVGNCASRA
ncbi:hypothetical protein [Paraburkholderia sp. SIMBA_027]|uniref:hypothetical protein n=1 Tax=Paraburkholderia sp. SIMBA_027 TaxID=3085770 RepID=UPI00397AD782